MQVKSWCPTQGFCSSNPAPRAYVCRKWRVQKTRLYESISELVSWRDRAYYSGHACLVDKGEPRWISVLVSPSPSVSVSILEARSQKLEWGRWNPTCYPHFWHSQSSRVCFAHRSSTVGTAHPTRLTADSSSAEGGSWLGRLCSPNKRGRSTTTPTTRVGGQR
jgi:hypothetical protein